MDRITIKHLEAKLERLVRITGNERYCLDWAYSGVQLCMKCKDSSGLSDVSYGYTTKRDLYNFMAAYEKGIYIQEVK